MTYVIMNWCIRCGSCSFECPAGAITEGEKQYVINPAKCVDCGACVEKNHCPAWAIFKEEDAPKD